MVEGHSEAGKGAEYGGGAGSSVRARSGEADQT
jgi:hypothetical protein